MSTEKNTEHFEDATCSAPYATATCVSLAPECTSSLWLKSKQDFKNIKNLKRCRDEMPKSMQTG